MPIGTVVLLLAVFCWGLSYKTSLYQNRHTTLQSRAFLPANILSEAERKAEPSRRVTTSGRKLIVQVVLYWIPATGPTIFDARGESQPARSKPRLIAELPPLAYLFIRPPPRTAWFVL